MRTLPKALIASTVSAAALVVVAPATVAHDSGDAHHMPGAGGAMGPGMMGEMGADMMELMGGWMSGQGRGEHPGMDADAPMRPQMPAMPEMPGEGMAPGTDGPRMPQMPQTPRMPGQDGMPATRTPGFQLQMAPVLWR